MATSRVRLGHMVVCTGFRNPALTAKLTSTLDVISGGRSSSASAPAGRKTNGRRTATASRRSVNGWTRSATTSRSSHGCSARATRRTRALRPGPQGDERAQGHPAAHPDHRGRQRRAVTAGFAVKYGDELNFVFLEPDEIATRMTQVRARCEAEGRDPTTLRFSIYVRDEQVRDAGAGRVDLLGRLANRGLDRVVCFPTRWSPTPRGAGRVRRRLPGGRSAARARGGRGDRLERPRSTRRSPGARRPWRHPAGPVTTIVRLSAWIQ